MPYPVAAARGRNTATAATAVVVAIQPAAAAGLDTYIKSDSAVNNYGVATSMLVRTLGSSFYSRGLLQFDLSSIPPGSTILSAILSLTAVGGAAGTLTIGAHRGLTQWYEGAKDTAPPAAGEDGSTWNLRNANGAVAWAGGAGGGAGTDYAAVATATTAVNAVSGAFTWNITADVAAWVAGTANYGVWLIAQLPTGDPYKFFGSSDHATPGSRPLLTVTYI